MSGSGCNPTLCAEELQEMRDPINHLSVIIGLYQKLGCRERNIKYKTCPGHNPSDDGYYEKPGRSEK